MDLYMRNGRKSQIVKELREDIYKGRLAPKSRIPTRDELQIRFGVSRQTVQNAIDVLVRDGFLRAVRSEGTFVMDEPPHLCNYGFASDNPFSASRFTHTMQRAAMKLVENGNVKFSFYCYAHGSIDSEGYRRLLEDVEARRLAGIIFPFPPEGLWDKPVLKAPGLPMVSNSRSENESIPQIFFDHRSFLVKAAAFLAAQGRKRIAQIGSWLHRKEMEESISYLLERGLSAPALTQACSPTSPFSAYQAALVLMELPANRRPDAMIIYDDHLVETATEALGKLGLRFPDDLGVVAHCNFPDRPVSSVPVTRLGLDCMDLIRRDIKCLEAQRGGRKTAMLQKVPAVFESELPSVNEDRYPALETA